MNTSLTSTHPSIAANRQSENYNNTLPTATAPHKHSNSTSMKHTLAQTTSASAPSHISVEKTLALLGNALNEIMTSLNNLLNIQPSVKTLVDNKPLRPATDLPHTTLETTQVVDEATAPNHTSFFQPKKVAKNRMTSGAGCFLHQCSRCIRAAPRSVPMSRV